jgi:hypothetical protein
MVGIALGLVLASVTSGCARPDAFERASRGMLDYDDAIARMEGRPVVIRSADDPAAEVSSDAATAVVEVWERYRRSRFELGSSSPSAGAMDIEGYSIEDARRELLTIYRRVVFRGYVDGRSATSERIEVRLTGPSSAELEACVIETGEPYWDDGSLVEPEDRRQTAWARFVRVTEGRWSVAEVDFEGRRC